MKYRYLIINEWDAIWGTNDKDDALVAAQESQVYDCETGEIVGDDDEREDVDLFVPQESEGDDE